MKGLMNFQFVSRFQGSKRGVSKGRVVAINVIWYIGVLGGGVDFWGLNGGGGVGIRGPEKRSGGVVPILRVRGPSEVVFGPICLYVGYETLRY